MSSLADSARKPLSLDGISNDTVRKAYDAIERMSGGDQALALPLYRKFREQGPLVRGDGGYFPEGFVVPPQIAVELLARGTPSAMTLNHASLREAMSDSGRFGFDAYKNLGPGRTPLLTDGQEHRRVRILLAKGLNPKSIRHWEDDLINPVVLELIGRFKSRGKAELRAELTEPLPARAIGAVLGLPASDLPQFNVLALLQQLPHTEPDSHLAMSRLHAYFFEQITVRRRLTPAILSQREDVISLMLTARDGNDDGFSDDEINGILHFLLFAGTETTNRTLANAITYLLHDQSTFDAVRNDRSLVPKAIEETLRLAPGGALNARVARLDTEICGVPIAKGTLIILNILMGNRDSDIWDRPDEFDIFRLPRQHVAFGVGGHMCPGMHLARLEMKIALNLLFDHCTNLRLDPDYPKPELRGIGLIGSTPIHVLFD